MKIKRVNPITVATKKSACVCRYGAWGDALLLSPVLKKLKEDGYYVVLNCTERCYEVLLKNPYIDSFWIQETNEIPNDKLDDHWAELATAFDKFINLNGTIEGQLLALPWNEDYKLPKDKLHEKMNVNYMDHTMSVAGYPDAKGLLPEMFFKKREEDWAKAVRNKHPGFLVVYSLSGSSAHKTYPYADSVIQAIVEGIPNSTVLLVGEKGCKGIVEPHPRIIDMCGDFGIRKSLVLTKVADLVISTETSVASGAACFDTPKIILLSHSSVENLTKYWKNCHNVEPPVSCFPCHKLHYYKNTCPTDEQLQMPVCVSLLAPERILEKVELVYEAWQKQKAFENLKTEV